MKFFKLIKRYLSLFEQPANDSKLFFEKSANYFTELKAPQRLKSLLSEAKLVLITIDPADRAYSWYQVTFGQNNHKNILK